MANQSQIWLKFHGHKAEVLYPGVRVKHTGAVRSTNLLGACLPGNFYKISTLRLKLLTVYHFNAHTFYVY